MTRVRETDTITVTNGAPVGEYLMPVETHRLRDGRTVLYPRGKYDPSTGELIVSLKRRPRPRSRRRRLP